MINLVYWVLSQSNISLLILLVSIASVSVIAGLILIQYLIRVRRDNSDIGPVPPYMATVTTLFALIIALYANEVYGQQKMATKNFLSMESSYIQIREFLKSTDLCRTNANDLLNDYATISRDEHIQAQYGKTYESELNNIYSKIIISLGGVPNTFSRTASGIISPLLIELRKSQVENQWIKSHLADSFTWVAILILGFLSHLAIASTHTDRPKGGFVALLLFSVASSVVYFYIIKLENPFFSKEAQYHLEFLNNYISIGRDEFACNE
jgi:hypothetical protein